jgi:hypothetical protein
MRGAFTPQSAAGGIGPCLSTGEPGAAAATRRSTPAWPSRHRVPLPRCPRATACQHFRRGWNQRSTSALPSRHRVPTFSSRLQPTFHSRAALAPPRANIFVAAGTNVPLPRWPALPRANILVVAGTNDPIPRRPATPAVAAPPCANNSRRCTNDPIPVADRVPMVAAPTLDSAAGHVRAFVDAADVRIECGRAGRWRNGEPGCSGNVWFTRAGLE